MTFASDHEDCLGCAARDPSGVLSPCKFSRRAIGREDVSLDIAYCGVCYADVVRTRNKTGYARYPARHEITGIARQVGSHVKRFKTVLTFDGIDADGTVTKGGCSSYIVVHERQVNTAAKDFYKFGKAERVKIGGTFALIWDSCLFTNDATQPGKSLGVIWLGGLAQAYPRKKKQ
ncbi:unnamed protein product [Coffea canephora]|uniref:Uncharacterized protein n=1 Tax=Coffea canephora TaxID=49390 RepID=A0A068UK24_COFCA|nr:unnamed protein product [Coffea canephora]